MLTITISSHGQNIVDNFSATIRSDTSSNHIYLIFTGHDFDEGFFASGGLEALTEWVADGCPGGLEVDPLVRLGPPVNRPSKLVCVDVSQH